MGSELLAATFPNPSSRTSFHLRLGGKAKMFLFDRTLDRQLPENRSVLVFCTTVLSECILLARYQKQGMEWRSFLDVWDLKE